MTHIVVADPLEQSWLRIFRLTKTERSITTRSRAIPDASPRSTKLPPKSRLYSKAILWVASLRLSTKPTLQFCNSPEFQLLCFRFDRIRRSSACPSRCRARSPARRWRPWISRRIRSEFCIIWQWNIKRRCRRHSVGGYQLESDSPTDRAATKIQAEIRGFLTRKHVDKLKKDNNHAATKIQAHIR